MPASCASTELKWDDLSPVLREAIEARTQELGRELFAALPREASHIWQRRWWDDRLLAWSMRDERLKVQLFRFVDVLPMLTTSEAVVEHLHAYLDEVRDRLPPTIGVALGVVRRLPFTGAAVARAARLAAMDFAKRFIAGETIPQVLAAARRERVLRRAFTLDRLGETVISQREAEQYFQAYVQLLEEVAPQVALWPEDQLVDRDHRGPIPRMNLSVKLSALDCHFDPIDPEGVLRRAGGRLRELCRVARRVGAFLHVDMESYDKKDLTLYLFHTILSEREFADWPDVGIVLQCYLRDTPADLVALADLARRRGTPLGIRLVKGAYWDYEVIRARASGWPIPVYTQKWESDLAFERATRWVLRHLPAFRPALGSHNLRSLAHGMATAERLELPPGALELQMLYGMADPEKQVLVERGQRLRVYMPYGELIPGMAYLVRRLLENTSNDSFLRAGFLEHRPVEDLLRAPQEIAAQQAPPERAAVVPAAALLDQAASRSAQALPPGTPASLPATGGTPPSAEVSSAAAAADPQALSSTSGSSIAPEPGRVREPAAIMMRPTDSPSLSATRAPFANQPPVDFSRAENRQRMQQALAQVRRELGRHCPLRIADRDVDTEERGTSHDPSEKTRIVGTFALATGEHVLQAVAVAHKALAAWAATDVAQRSALVRRAAALLRQRLFDYAAWEVYECGKNWREATADVNEAIDFCEYYAWQAEELQGQERIDVPGEENVLHYLPRGVAAVIAPWNFPLAILTGMTIAALVTGNTVIVKPAEQASVVARLLVELLVEAGLPAGVVNYLPGVGEIAGAALVEHPQVAVIAFTGSRSVGLAINARAAEVSRHGTLHVKRVIAEMGGKNAIIVDADADLDEAVAGVVHSAFGFQGQKCSACSRVIPVGPVYEPFLQRLIEATASLKIAPAEDPGCQLGPVIDEEALVRIHRYIEIGKQEGRLVLAVDPGPLVERGWFVGPHIFTDVLPTARIAQEEIFGPVLAVLRAADLDEALRIANGTEYALTGGMYSRHPLALERARREFLVGNLYLNRPITGALVHRQPFGGFKMSGIGSKAGGRDYLLQFVLPRTITENTMRRGFAPPPETEPLPAAQRASEDLDAERSHGPSQPERPAGDRHGRQ